MDALITYGGNRVSYSAMRSLASLGLSVALADASRIGMGQWSRFCKRSYLCADPLKHPDAFIDDIIRILSESGARFLLPGMMDTEIIAKHRGRLPGGVMLPVADYEKIRSANDKNIMASFARSIGVNVPEVIKWRSCEELADKLSATDFRVVVKLRQGESAEWVFYPMGVSQAVALCNDLAASECLAPGHLPMVQRHVAGEGWGVSCLYHEGRKLASFTHKRLREVPATGGPSTLRVSARNKTIEDYAERLLDGLSWHGIAMVEFKVDPESGEAWFIEINPRLWGSISLSVASGVDLVKLLYIAHTEGPDKALEMARPQREGVVCRWWLGDATLAFLDARRFRLRSALKLLMPGGTDFYDDIRMDDLGATAGAFARPAARFLKHMWQKQTNDAKAKSHYLGVRHVHH